MKVLVIHGSPRKRNTWDVLNLVKAEMSKEERIEFEDIELIKENIPICNGCFMCFYKGENVCPHYEKISKIARKIEMADALIITSPVYSLQITGLLKNFIDHMSYNFHRPRYFTKKALVITTTAGAGHKDAADYIKNVLYSWGLNYVHTIPVAFRGKGVSNKNKDKILLGARKFIIDLKSKKLKTPSIKEVVMFNAWRAMTRKKYDEGSADYEYWRKNGLANVIFPSEVKIGIIKRVIGNSVYKFMCKAV